MLVTGMLVFAYASKDDSWWGQTMNYSWEEISNWFSTSVDPVSYTHLTLPTIYSV